MAKKPNDHVDWESVNEDFADVLAESQPEFPTEIPDIPEGLKAT